MSVHRAFRTAVADRQTTLSSGGMNMARWHAPLLDLLLLAIVLRNSTWPERRVLEDASSAWMQKACFLP